MKLSVIIASVVFGMSLTAVSEKASALDPWCNPSYCPPTPGYPGSGETSREEDYGDTNRLVAGVVSCDSPVQERYAAVLAAYLADPIYARVIYYEQSPRGEFHAMYTGIAELNGRLAFESWTITDPSSSVPIAPNPVPGFECRR